MKNLFLHALLISLPSVCTVSASSDITDFSIELEDSVDQEVTVLFQGPNGVPHDIVVVNPGPWAIDLEDLPPDSYSLVFHSEGFAEQTINITYRDGKFIVTSESTDNTFKLFRKRYATIELVWNPNRSRELGIDSSKKEIFTTSYLGRNSVIGPDWGFTQTISGPEAKRASRQSGPNLVLRKHRYSTFFGVSFPHQNENFDNADSAPSNDMYRGGGMIFLKTGDWFYLRIKGHKPETIAYAKLRVLDVSLVPPVKGNLLKERAVRWQRALETARRLGIELPN